MHQAFGLNIPQTLPEMCDPRTMALVVYDMQAGIVSQIKNGAEITAKVAALLSAARAGGYRVFFSRYMTLPKEAAGIVQLRMAMNWQRVASPDLVKTMFSPSSPGFQLVPEMEPRPTEPVLDRITMSAFEANPLPIALRDCGIVSVVFMGIALEIGIDPSVRHVAPTSASSPSSSPMPAARATLRPRNALSRAWSSQATQSSPQQMNSPHC